MSPGSKWLLSQETLGVQKRAQQAVAAPPPKASAGYSNPNQSFLMGQLQRSSAAGQMRVSLPRAPFSPVGSGGAQALSPGSQWLNETMGH